MPVLQFVEFGEVSADAKTRSETYRDEKGQLIAQIVWDQYDRITLFCLYPDVGGRVVVTSTYGKNGTLVSQNAQPDDNGFFSNGKICSLWRRLK
jgi:hypothetical protein